MWNQSSRFDFQLKIQLCFFYMVTVCKGWKKNEKKTILIESNVLRNSLKMNINLHYRVKFDTTDIT